MQVFFFDLQPWQITVFLSLELQWWKVAHLKAPRHIYFHLLKKQHSITFNICQDVLKSGNLLRNLDFVDFQMVTTVPSHYFADNCGISCCGRWNTVDFYSLKNIFKGSFDIIGHHLSKGLRSLKIWQILSIPFLSLKLD